MKISNMATILLLAAAVAISVFLPGKAAPLALVHVERIHVVEPGESISDIARQYFGEQKEYDNINRYIYAVRVANGLDKTIKPGDRLIIPLAIAKESLKGGSK